MDIKINGKTLLLGLFVMGSFSFGEYVSIINGGNFISMAAEPDVEEPPVIVGIVVLDRVETATGGYTLWSDGYKEVWGRYNKGSSLLSSDTITISLPISFDVPSNAVGNLNVMSRTFSGVSTVHITSIGSSSFVVQPDQSYSGNLDTGSFMWELNGF